MRGVPWGLYEQLLDVIGDGLPRLTYDRGSLELEMPSELHEVLKWIAARIVEAYLDNLGLEYKAVGSTTWRREEVEGGLEADESYYIANATLVAGRSVDLERDPPPDLAIAIDLSAPEVEEQSVYARLRVPEIWRWRGGELAVLGLRPDGTYLRVPRSDLLPDFPLARLGEALADYPSRTQAQIVRDFRRWLGESRGR